MYSTDSPGACFTNFVWYIGSIGILFEEILLIFIDFMSEECKYTYHAQIGLSFDVKLVNHWKINKKCNEKRTRNISSLECEWPRCQWSWNLWLCPKWFYVFVFTSFYSNFYPFFSLSKNLHFGYSIVLNLDKILQWDTEAYNQS